jgi:DNA-binding NarL/FixJ family response regulator
MLDRKPIRVLIAEPQQLLREALVALCERNPDLEVADQCADGAAALRLILQRPPDVALLELDLPELHTLELLNQAREQHCPTRIVLMTARSDRKTVIEALRCGAHGIVLKSGSARHLMDALQQVTSGGVYISPAVEVDKIFAAHRNRKENEDPFETLSAREHQVFTMLVEGHRAKEIAARLAVSPKTIDTYRASMMRKLDIHDVAGLVKFAITRNLTSLPGAEYSNGNGSAAITPHALAKAAS